MNGLHNKLRRVLKCFSLKDIYKHAINEFPNIVWEHISKHLHDKKKVLKQIEVINAILELTIHLEISLEEISRIIHNLELLAIAVSTKKTWVAYKLLEPRSRIPSVKQEMQQNLEKSFRRNNITVKLNVIDYDGKFAISVMRQTSPKKRGVQPHYLNPLFFILDAVTQYFFSNKILSDNKFIVAFINALGYHNFKPCQLSGRNIEDLLKLLIIKEKNKEKLDFEIPEFVPLYKITEKGIDFTQKAQRSDYADKLYGEPPPELQSLTFKVQNYMCQTQSLAGESFSAELQFTSPDVINMVKDAIVDDFIECPVPDYLQNVLKCGKNIFNVKNQNL